MTLDVTVPTDQNSAGQIPTYIRENRVAINALSGGSNTIAQNDVELAGGETSMTVGSELSSAGLETVVLSALGAANIATILGGTDGQVKVFIFQDANIDFVDGNDKSAGKLFLNHLPAASNFDAQQDDVMALRNIGGDGAAEHGYWIELFRTISVK